jgi:hypothetical protein
LAAPVAATAAVVGHAEGNPSQQQQYSAAFGNQTIFVYDRIVRAHNSVSQRGFAKITHI